MPPGGQIKQHILLPNLVSSATTAHAYDDQVCVSSLQRMVCMRKAWLEL